MKAPLCTLFALCLAVSLGAQPSGSQYAPEQLDQLVGPIALYPDPLVALILPASTTPSDISQAAQYLASGGNPAGVDSQPWADSVKGLAHYPDVLKWMSDNIEWTQTLGAAFAMQPADVMKSIQQDRAKAMAAGTLTSTPQQQIEMEGDDIRIVPADPDTIYVPQYDADQVYEPSDDVEGPFITFGLGFPVGPWLGFECDWDDYGIWAGPWHPGWEYRRDWRDARGGGHRWQPDAARGRTLVRDFYRPGVTTMGPRPMPGARPVQPRAAMAPRQPAPVMRSVPDYRGYGAVPSPSTPAPRTSVFGGYSRGTQARAYSSRGQASRAAPARPSFSSRSEPSAPVGRDRR